MIQRKPSLVEPVEPTELEITKFLDLLVEEHKHLDFTEIAQLLKIDVDELFDSVLKQLHDEKTGQPLTLVCCTPCLLKHLRILVAVGIEVGRRTAGKQKVQ
jgi:hypothetical protein